MYFLKSLFLVLIDLWMPFEFQGLDLNVASFYLTFCKENMFIYESIDSWGEKESNILFFVLFFKYRFSLNCFSILHEVNLN